MKHTIAVVAALAFAGLLAVPSARAEQVPSGSYQQSCRDIRIENGVLSAQCRAAGGWQRAQLTEAHRCVGDIGNNNGTLACNRGPAAGSSVGRAPVPPAPAPRCAAITDLVARERCLNGL